MALTRFERVFLAVLALAAALALSILALAGWRTHRHNAALRPQLETVYRLTPTDTFVRDPAADLAREGPPVNINAATRDELQTALGIPPIPICRQAPSMISGMIKLATLISVSVMGALGNSVSGALSP